MTSAQASSPLLHDSVRLGTGIMLPIGHCNTPASHRQPIVRVGRSQPIFFFLFYPLFFSVNKNKFNISWLHEVLTKCHPNSTINNKAQNSAIFWPDLSSVLPSVHIHSNFIDVSLICCCCWTQTDCRAAEMIWRYCSFVATEPNPLKKVIFLFFSSPQQIFSTCSVLPYFLFFLHLLRVFPLLLL